MTVAEVKAYFKEFENTSDDEIQRALDVAIATLNKGLLKDKYNLALLYLTAHFLVVVSKQFKKNSSPTSNINSKSVDGVSISYGQATNLNDYMMGMLSTTSYGQMYLRLTAGFGAGGFVC